MKELPLNLQIPEMERAVLADERTAKWLEEKQIQKIIIVPGRIINMVIG